MCVHAYVCLCIYSGTGASDGLAEIAALLEVAPMVIKNGIKYAHDHCFVIHASTTSILQ